MLINYQFVSRFICVTQRHFKSKTASTSDDEFRLKMNGHTYLRSNASCCCLVKFLQKEKWKSWGCGENAFKTRGEVSFISSQTFTEIHLPNYLIRKQMIYCRISSFLYLILSVSGFHCSWPICGFWGYDRAKKHSMKLVLNSFSNCFRCLKTINRMAQMLLCFPLEDHSQAHQQTRKWRNNEVRYQGILGS